MISTLLPLVFFAVLSLGTGFQVGSSKAKKAVSLRAGDLNYNDKKAGAGAKTVKLSSRTKVQVALTRELGKNEKLRKAIESHSYISHMKNSCDFQLLEIPCIQHSLGRDLDLFVNLCTSELSKYDYIIITSPESANVFADSIHKARIDFSQVSCRIAAVGKATEKALISRDFAVDFVPTKANGKTLAEELPVLSSKTRVHQALYPASAKAAKTIEEMLSKRNDPPFEVTRFDTYDTLPAIFTEEQCSKIIKKEIQLVCFGSPSSVNAWISNVDASLGIADVEYEGNSAVLGINGGTIAICIGGTTAKRCAESQRWEPCDVYYPEKNPGIDGWVESCVTALKDNFEQ